MVGFLGPCGRFRHTHGSPTIFAGFDTIVGNKRSDLGDKRENPSLIGMKKPEKGMFCIALSGRQEMLARAIAATLIAT